MKDYLSSFIDDIEAINELMRKIKILFLLKSTEISTINCRDEK